MTAALTILFVLVGLLLLGGVATRYVAKTWGPLLHKKEVNMSLFTATLLGVFVSGITIPFAIVTWVLKKLS